LHINSKQKFINKQLILFIMETNALNISNAPRKIIIKNFGPIKKADIDIVDFTDFKPL